MSAQRILIRGVNWLGDAVMSTPALLRLRQARPQAQITLLSPEKLADLWRHHPAIDTIMTFTRGEAVWQVARRLRSEQFHLAVVLPNSWRSALEVWLARIPQRLGYSGQGRGILLTQAIEPRPGAVRMRKRSAGEIRGLIRRSDAQTSPGRDSAAHHLHQYLHLTAALGANPEPLAPQLVVRAEETHEALTRFGLESDGPSARPLFGLNPGAEYGPAKRWPEDRFVAAALEMRKQTNCRWIIFGGQDDVELANRIVARIESADSGKPGGPARPTDRSVWNLAGTTGLRELCALLKACRALLTNDTGPMHVAAAVGTPVVAPFGSTSPELTGPGLPGDPRHHLLQAAVPCAPCFRRECPIDFRCMARLSVEQVVQALMKCC
ncbi:MAG: lipopolysaccharide heptosyltransferase II [Chloroflexi bacterium]|nr:lipopolysaccharide heptosyltransferase II [Chloroflexota bacterium]